MKGRLQWLKLDSSKPCQFLPAWFLLRSPARSRSICTTCTCTLEIPMYSTYVHVVSFHISRPIECASSSMDTNSKICAKGGGSSADPIDLLSSDDDDDDGDRPAVVERKETTYTVKDGSISVPSSIPYHHPPQDAFPPSASFRTALSELVSSVEANETTKPFHRIHSLVCFSSSSAICFYDKYHKARKHLLLIPRPTSPLGKVNSISGLVPSIHLSHLKEFHSLGRAIASAVRGRSRSDGSRHPMLCGYHSVPSLVPLHLHIISSDFDSDYVKNKKHINSFTNSSFFVSTEILEQHMESAANPSARVQVDEQRANSLINATPFSCFRCNTISENVPKWKQHNRTCQSTLPNNYERQLRNGSLLGWQSGSILSGKKRKAEESNREGNKDIRTFFGGSDKDGEGPTY